MCSIKNYRTFVGVCGVTLSFYGLGVMSGYGFGAGNSSVDSVDSVDSAQYAKSRIEALSKEASDLVVMEGGRVYSKQSDEGKEVVRRLDYIQSLSNPTPNPTPNPYPTPIPINIPGAPYDHMDPIDLFLPPVSTPPPTPILTPTPAPTPPPMITPTPYPTPDPIYEVYPTPLPTPVEEYCVLSIPILSTPPPTPVLTPTPAPTPPPMITPTPYPTPNPIFEFYPSLESEVGEEPPLVIIED